MGLESWLMSGEGKRANGSLGNWLNDSWSEKTQHSDVVKVLTCDIQILRINCCGQERERIGEHEDLRIAPSTKSTNTELLFKLQKKKPTTTKKQHQNENSKTETFWMAEIGLASLYLFTYSCWSCSFTNEILSIMKCVYPFIFAKMKNSFTQITRENYSR